jgi:hypothetical protein
VGVSLTAFLALLNHSKAMAMTSVIPDEFLRRDDGKMRLLSWLMLGLVMFMAVSHVAQLWFLWIPSSLFKALHLCLGIVVLCAWNAPSAALPKSPLWAAGSWA